jgi:NAD-specific glutamate dehydrogenase
VCAHPPSLSRAHTTHTHTHARNAHAQRTHATRAHANRYIVEGANLFITEPARNFLQDKGVLLFKDASTNKGGVTSSSLEVLAGLSMTDEEFAQHMQADANNGNVPEFYAQ